MTDHQQGNHGTAWQERGLKHRAVHETRTILIPPGLVRLLRAHIGRFGAAPDGRIFQTSQGGIIQDRGRTRGCPQGASAVLASLTEVGEKSRPGRSAVRATEHASGRCSRTGHWSL